MRSPPTPSATRPGPSALNASQILRTEEDRLVVLEKARRREALDSAMKRVVLGVLLLVALFIVVGGGRRVMNGHHHRDGDLLRHLRVCEEIRDATVENGTRRTSQLFLHIIVIIRVTSHTLSSLFRQTKRCFQ